MILYKSAHWDFSVALRTAEPSRPCTIASFDYPIDPVWQAWKWDSLELWMGRGIHVDIFTLVNN